VEEGSRSVAYTRVALRVVLRGHVQRSLLAFLFQSTVPVSHITEGYCKNYGYSSMT
jgi:hypothetical protein